MLAFKKRICWYDRLGQADLVHSQVWDPESKIYRQQDRITQGGGFMNLTRIKDAIKIHDHIKTQKMKKVGAACSICQRKKVRHLKDSIKIRHRDLNQNWMLIHTWIQIVGSKESSMNMRNCAELLNVENASYWCPNRTYPATVKPRKMITKRTRKWIRSRSTLIIVRVTRAILGWKSSPLSRRSTNTITASK